MAIRTEKAFVLRQHDFRDTSKIASLFTEHSGRIKGIFKGIRAGKKNFVTTLDVGTENEVVFYPSRGELWLISYAEMLKAFSYGHDLELASAVCYMAEAVDRTMPLHAPSPEVYALIADAHEAIKDRPWQQVIAAFQVKLLELSGFRPTLLTCAGCGCRLSFSVRFNCRMGGFVCEECDARVSDTSFISVEAAQSLQFLQRNTFDASLRLKPTAGASDQMRTVLGDFFEYHTGARLRSLLAAGRAQECVC